MTLSLSSPVQGQLDAYNKRDINSFLSFYSENVMVFDLASGRTILEGKAAMAAHYEALFAKSPDLHCEVVNRAMAGRFVIDREAVSGRQGLEQVLDVFAIYEVVEHDDSQFIARVWFAK